MDESDCHKVDGDFRFGLLCVVRYNEAREKTRGLEVRWAVFGTE